ncbi:NTP transferase domain-containing protein [Shewanella waksmanii]|uniref:phosphocholine cytidylyltransferase family protein n=1 Tax=Shewanella waksmanii TaxID=213783 RepID=UPI003736F3AE
MRALILASGRGSRLGNLTEQQPKGFTKVAGKKLIDWQLSALKCAGVEDIAVTTGYFKDCFNTLFKNQFYNHNWSTTNMVSSMLCAKSFLANQDTIVSYSDIIYSKKTIEQLVNDKNDITIAYDPNWLTQWQARYENPLDDAESFNQVNGVLTDIGRKVDSLNEVKGQYMGLLKFSKLGWSQVNTYLGKLSAQELAALDMTTMLQNLVSLGITINTVEISDEWFEVDTLQDLKVAEDHVPSFSWLNHSA